MVEVIGHDGDGGDARCGSGGGGGYDIKWRDVGKFYNGRNDDVGCVTVKTVVAVVVDEVFVAVVMVIDLTVVRW